MSYVGSSWTWQQTPTRPSSTTWRLYHRHGAPNTSRHMATWLLNLSWARVEKYSGNALSSSATSNGQRQ
eukprot:8795639-Pyramimonas_sp.AAC.1